LLIIGGNYACNFDLWKAPQSDFLKILLAELGVLK